ncbi:MAG: phosphodiester glycosidase family protein [Patescibacteria group bacterium]
MKKALLIAILLLATTGCTQQVTVGNLNIGIEADTNTEKQYQEEWLEMEKGINFKEMPIYEKSGQEEYLQDVVTVFKFDPQYFTFSLKQQTQNPLVISKWQEKYKPLFVCNGGYFMENNLPSSLLKINGEQYGTKLGADSVGELVIDDNGQPDILENADNSQYNNLLQSYPLLVRPDGVKSLKDDSGQVAPRSIIAKDAEGNILFIFTSNYYFSLYNLQDYLADSDLNLKIALNLDGGPSSGYYLNSETIKKSESDVVPNVVMVNKK